jgi:integrase
MADARRRGYGEDGIYFDHRGDCRDSAHHKTCAGRWRGVVSLGFNTDGKRVRMKEKSRLHAFIVLCLMTGVRSEEARALTWEHVDLDAGTIMVWRSVRAHGDTKTARSRRTLKLPEIAVEALRAQKRRQAAERDRAGDQWQEHGLSKHEPTSREL